MLLYHQTWFIILVVAIVSLAVPVGFLALVALLGMKFFLWLTMKLSITPAPERSSPVQLVESGDPIRAWKRASIGLGSKPFIPLYSDTRYSANEAAQCIWGLEKSEIPHLLGNNHRCGFYAFLEKYHAQKDLQTSGTQALLEVDLYGHILEGDRGVVRAGYQRVVKVWFPAYCWKLTELHVEPAAGFRQFNEDFLVPACRKCLAEADVPTLTLTDMRNLVQTEVGWLPRSPLPYVAVVLTYLFKWYESRHHSNSTN